MPLGNARGQMHGFQLWANLPRDLKMTAPRYQDVQAGDIETVEAKDRPAFDARGRAARYDWRGCFWGYRRIGPRRIPEWGEVGYVYPDGYEVYFRGRILSYELIV